MPQVIKVIEAEEPEGKGIESDPYRIVKRYYTLDGKLLAENDPMPRNIEIREPTHEK